MTRISICIPAFNRPHTLAELLRSIVTQDYTDFEIVICEDFSPARKRIRSVVASCQHASSGRHISYFENKENMGYDSNIRCLLEVAQGEYCLFMGDDDLLCPGMLRRVGTVLERYPNLGAVNRAYLGVDRFSGAVLTENRYYSGDRYFPAGVETAVSFFRRFVTISGLVLNRRRSVELATSRFDGTLLYQLYLVANLLLDMDGYYISDIISIRRSGEDHFFGSSSVEKGLFAPRTLTPEHSTNFMKGMVRIASYVGVSRNVPIYRPILKDLASYAYAFLNLHSAKKRSFLKYARELGETGLGQFPIFWIHVAALMVLNAATLSKVIELSKRIYGRAPSIGGLYQGVPVVKPEPKSPGKGI